ncbi:MAG: hypothetical protein GY822_25495 [Deltaproteobacteria bacterium]|nr:hypothetical protein [Deltaproteobacteria bacterium]
MKFSSWLFAVFVSGILLWGASTLYRLFNEENHFQLSFVQKEEERQGRDQKQELLQRLSKQAATAPKEFSQAKAAVYSSFRDLVVVEQKKVHAPPRLLWPLPASSTAEKEKYATQWQIGHVQLSSRTALDAFENDLSIHERERIVLLDKIIHSFKGSQRRGTETNRTLRAFQMHREVHRLHPAFELATLLRLEKVIVDRENRPLSSWIEILFAGQPKNENAPLGLFALSIRVHSAAEKDLAEEILTQVRMAARQAGLPLSTWEAALRANQNVKHTFDFLKMKFEHSCEIQSHGDSFLLGCRRGAT